MGFAVFFMKNPGVDLLYWKIGHLQLATARAITLDPRACTLLILVNFAKLHSSEFASELPDPLIPVIRVFGLSILGYLF